MAAGLAGEVLLLSRRDVKQLMSPGDWLASAERAFAAAVRGAGTPAPMHIAATGGGFHAKGARIQLERSYVALKFNGNFPGNPDSRRLPTIQGAIILCDGADGSLLAILDSIEVTLRRTAAATALAARYLARPDAATVLVCGCGQQAGAQLAALRDVLPLRSGFAWDRDAGRAAAFVRAAEGLKIEPTGDLRAAARRSDVIVTCTTSCEPFLDADMVRPGAFVAAVGADAPSKSEIVPELMAKALVVVDSLDQCAAMGDLHHALGAGAIRREDVRAELSELVGGVPAGRSNDEEITLFDSTGTAVQDAAAAALVYERAQRRPKTARFAFGVP